MGKILVLDQATINQIAAGEVIERPSSVVKELVENAMDAGATAITVEIKEGGISFIRVTDNGSGFAKEDIRLAFLRHSTSKIRSVEDLMCVGSLGFRGEALSSIAAVAQVELITCATGQAVGSRYRIEGGQEIGLEDIGAPEGTTFIVRNLFYNTPVRRKFLKTAMTEGSYISELMERMALSHPEVSFRLIVNGQMKLHTAGNHNLKDIIYSTFGREITANLIPVDAKGSIVSVSGFLGKPLIARGNRSYEIYFINGRYIKSKIINKAIEDGYKSFLMQHKYPLVVLHLQIEPEFLDVNVHPTKMELRFRGEREIYEFLVGVVRDALMGKELIPKVSLTDEKTSKSASVEEKQAPIEKKPEPFEKNRLHAIQQMQAQQRARYQERSDNKALPDGTGGVTYSVRPNQSSWGSTVRESKPVYGSDPVTGLKSEKQDLTKQEFAKQESPKQESTKQASVEKIDVTKTVVATPEKVESSKIEPTKSASDESIQAEPLKDSVKPTVTYTQTTLFEEKIITPEKKAQFRLIGQLFDTYWLLQVDKEFLIIDQHAAHEKVLYERTIKQLEQAEMPSQQVAPPLILTLSPVEIDTINTNQELFERMGFTIEPFGGREYAVYSVPGHLYGIADRELLLEMIDELADAGKAGMNLLAERVATASCKAAVKGNNRLSFAEAEHLLEELLTLDNPYHCPHGRPTIISMSQYELEKKFKRIL
ncbi:MAG: DNA mismatch repair endonuclease MutL [Lachnospiraceae bacterium]|nr:DNA mismatch repair endonuclease MutL [Lachnospiraceae bacterium]